MWWVVGIVYGYSVFLTEYICWQPSEPFYAIVGLVLSYDIFVTLTARSHAVGPSVWLQHVSALPLT